MSDNFRSNLVRLVQECQSETGLSFMDFITDVMLDGQNGNPSDTQLVDMIKNYGSSV